MSLTVLEARKELSDMLLNSWDDATVGFNNGTPVPVLWGDREYRHPIESGPWIRVYVRHTGSDLASLGKYEDGKQNWERRGTVSVQVFTDIRQDADGRQVLSLAREAQKIYEGKTTNSGIWLRNVQMRDSEREQQKFRTMLVRAEFEYNEVS